jgi:phage gp46-like protein
MAGRDRIIDPATKDYVKNSTGGYATTTTIGTQIYHQMSTKLGHWWGDPTAGSNLHLVTQYGAAEDGRVFATNAVKTSLSRFVSEGLARDLRVEAVAINNRISVSSSAVDIQGAQVGVSGVTPFEG